MEEGCKLMLAKIDERGQVVKCQETCKGAWLMNVKEEENGKRIKLCDNQDIKSIVSNGTATNKKKSGDKIKSVKKEKKNDESAITKIMKENPIIIDLIKSDNTLHKILYPRLEKMKFPNFFDFGGINRMSLTLIKSFLETFKKERRKNNIGKINRRKIKKNIIDA